MRRRFVAGRAASAVTTPAAIAAARSAAQASGVAHMGAHALGAKAAGLAASDVPEAVDGEIAWQLAHMTTAVRSALRRLPPVGEDSAGPVGVGGLLATGTLGAVIRKLQQALRAAG
ncbi:putative immunity protein [Agromyces sp. NPDC058484]|uniref:putative immunity protein n=1 Tax=Agromyces sp. NPDC058484 TaxID=3346524 RepID=UPI00365A3B36